MADKITTNTIEQMNFPFFFLLFVPFISQRLFAAVAAETAEDHRLKLADCRLGEPTRIQSLFSTSECAPSTNVKWYHLLVFGYLGFLLPGAAAE